MTRSQLLGPALALLAATLGGCAGPVPGDGDPGSEPGPSGDPDAGVDQAACPFKPRVELQKKVLFTEPGVPGDPRIADELVALFDASVPGSEVRVSLFAWEQIDAAEAAIAAADRGVDVRVVLQGLAEGAAPVEAVELLTANLGSDRVTRCVDGCAGTGANVNKYALFTALCDGSTSVVFQSSANLTGDPVGVHDNAVVIRNDPDLFAGFRQYFDDQSARIRAADYYRRTDGFGARAFFFPRAPGGDSGIDPSTDTSRNLLVNNVDCTAGGSIRLAAALWTSARRYLVGSLRQLRDAGCDVEIVVGRPDETIAADLEQAFAPEEITVEPLLHGTVLLIDAIYEGEPRPLLWTGSHNLTHSALRSNEDILLRLDDPGLFAAYTESWLGLRDR